MALSNFSAHSRESGNPAWVPAFAGTNGKASEPASRFAGQDEGAGAVLVLYVEPRLIGLPRRGATILPHTPVTILTGFLGSGKTTLLNRALRDPAMANTAVVINEFGEVGLDHMLAAQSDDTIMVLENGCLCCTVFGDLVTTLNNLYHAREAGEVPRFDHVVIETSGLADPSPLIQAFLSI